MTPTLSDEVYVHMLDQKLNKKLVEYQESKSVDELADLIEVIAAVANARGYSRKQLMHIRKRKRIKRGGCENRILLLEVADAPAKANNANLSRVLENLELCD